MWKTHWDCPLLCKDPNNLFSCDLMIYLPPAKFDLQDLFTHVVHKSAELNWHQYTVIEGKTQFRTQTCVFICCTFFLHWGVGTHLHLPWRCTASNIFPIYGGQKNKCFLGDTINRWIQETSLKCRVRGCAVLLNSIYSHKEVSVCMVHRVYQSAVQLVSKTCFNLHLWSYPFIFFLWCPWLVSELVTSGQWW